MCSKQGGLIEIQSPNSAKSKNNSIEIFITVYFVNCYSITRDNSDLSFISDLSISFLA